MENKFYVKNKDMERIIKFRAFDKRKSCMHEVIRIDFDNPSFNVQILCPTEIAPQNWELRKFEEVELMQFTGLTDKNGKKIYEGDILLQKTTEKFKEFNSSVWERIYTVKFGLVDFRESHAGNSTYGFYLESTHAQTIGIGSIASDNEFGYYPFEIIGNIYENKELLINGKKETQRR